LGFRVQGRKRVCERERGIERECVKERETDLADKLGAVGNLGGEGEARAHVVHLGSGLRFRV
jgi:hypothetical protein